MKSNVVTLNEQHIADALIGFDHRYRHEFDLFARRRNAETEAWYWAWDALIHWRRGYLEGARASWRRSFRLTLSNVPKWMVR
jgi:hypothetical protein